MKKTPFDPSIGKRDRKVSLVRVAADVNKLLKNSAPAEVPAHLGKFAIKPARDLEINYDRQRYPEPAHIQKILDNWDDRFCTPIICRRDPKTNRFYITDGQQHATAFVLKYGPDAEIPVFYFDSEDPATETDQFLSINTNSMAVSRYFLHEQAVLQKDPVATAIENAVTSVGCETGYKKARPGTITHITDLYNLVNDYSIECLIAVLSRYRRTWPADKIYTATMSGFMVVTDLLEKSNMFSDELFDEVFDAAEYYFSDSKRLHLDIKANFSEQYSNPAGITVKYRIASGLIDVYEQHTGKTLVDKPFDISIALI